MSGAVSLWDIESQSQSLSFRGHDDVINSIVGGGAGSSEILTGCLPYDIEYIHI